MSGGGSSRAVMAALAANLGIAVSKFVAFALSGSTAMLAEGVHSVADSGNQVLLMIGGRQSRRAADEQHPFGYGRDRYIFGFLVAVVLFSMGGLFALYEGWHKVSHALGHPGERLEQPVYPIVVLVVSIALESFSLRTAVRESNHVRGRAGWVRFVRTAKAPELPVVLLEDVGALTGLTFALAGVLLAVITGNPVWDGVGTLFIGALLVVIALVLAAETKSLLLGEAAAGEQVAAIRKALEAEPAVRRVIHMRTMHLGPEELLVAAKIAVAPGASAAQVADTIDAAEARVRDAVPIARVIYLEPDIDRSAAQVDAGV